MQKYNEINSKEQEAIKIIRAILLGTAIGLAVCAALLSLSSMIFVKVGFLPIDMLFPITTALGTVGAFFAGCLTLAAYKKRGLLLGCAAGFLMFIIVLITGAVRGSDSYGISTITKGIMFTFAGGIGGVLKVNAATKVKRH